MEMLRMVAKPVAILLCCLFAFFSVPKSADAYSSRARRDAWQKVVDYRDDAATSKRQAKILIAAAVVVAIVGIAATVATGGVAGPAVAAAVVALVAGGAGVAELTNAKAAQRKADFWEREYRATYGY